MGAEEYFRQKCPTCDGSGQDPADLTDAHNCLSCEGVGTVVDERALLFHTDHCWVQESWSAAINPKGAFFCEIAAAMSDLFDGKKGWKVEPDWWKRTPADFMEQRREACFKCGAAMPIKRIRNSQDATDDVSPRNLERLKAVGSRKVSRGEYQVREFEFDESLMKQGKDGAFYPHQTYKDEMYRRGIAERYGIALVLNPRGYWEPRLQEDMPQETPSVFRILNNQYQESLRA
jgi:hypothetical protein